MQLHLICSFQDSVTPLKTQSNAASVKDSSAVSIPTTAEESKQKLTGWKLFRSDCLPLTAGEVIQRHLKPKKRKKDETQMPLSQCLHAIIIILMFISTKILACGKLSEVFLCMYMLFSKYIGPL